MKLTRYAIISATILIVGGLTACDGKSSYENPVREEQEAARFLYLNYGGSEWNRVERLRFTFNVAMPGREVHRAWEWWPHEDRVAALGDPNDPSDDVTFTRADLGADAPDSLREIDAQFINDSYWFVFPMHLKWDRTQLSVHGPDPAPISGEPLKKLIVRYPSDGGYTPGDVYELYYDSTYTVREWVYRRRGAVDGRPITWEQTTLVGPLKIAMDHYGPDKQLRLWFSDVEVELRDPVEVYKAAP